MKHIKELCKKFGIKLYPFQIEYLESGLEKYPLPIEVLKRLDKTDFKKYLEALYLAQQEMAYDWDRGHDKLKELGFIETEVKSGHRVFVSLSYPTKI